MLESKNRIAMMRCLWHDLPRAEAVWVRLAPLRGLAGMTVLGDRVVVCRRVRSP